MRWLFASTDGELAAKARTIRAIDAWWKEFSACVDDLDALFARPSEWDLPAWMAKHLQTIDPRLMWEYGPPARGGRRRLVITPESEHAARPLVRTLLERAPAIDGWEFYDARLADPIDNVVATVRGRTGHDVRGWRARVRRDAKRIHLTFIADNSPDVQEAQAIGFVTAEGIAGETTLDRYLGLIDVETPGLLQRWFGSRSSTVALDDVRAAVQREVDAIQAELPSVTRAEFDDGTNYAGTVYRVDGPPPTTWAGTADILVATYLLPELFEATRRHRFYSTLFSRCGETFCYVKLDPERDGGSAELVALFETIDGALRERAVGCAVGRSFGHRYRYVDVAVTDISRAAEVLRAVDLPRASWLLFHDCELADEWIGLRDDTRPPPGFEISS